MHFFYKYISAPTKLPYVIFVMFKRIDEIDMTLKDEEYLEPPFGKSRFKIHMYVGTLNIVYNYVTEHV